MLYISAKEGRNLNMVFDAIIDRINPPALTGMTDENKLKMFLFDARYTGGRGVACFVKVMTGVPLDLNRIAQIISFHSSKRYEVYEVGII
jgi:translation elongation factor EF-4